MKLQHRPEYLVVLEALELGLEVKVGLAIFVMGETATGAKTVGVKFGEHVANPLITLESFIGSCEQLTQEQIVELCMDIALNKVKQEDAEKRRPT